MKKMLENIKWVIRSCKSKDNSIDKRKKPRGQTIIYNTLDRKLKIEQHESH